MISKRLEIAPGVYFQLESDDKCSLILASREQGDLICWDFSEIKRDPNSWFASLKAVALAVQHGPGIALKWVGEKKASLDSPAGTMICNVCNIKFVPSDDHPYIFAEDLNGRKYFDLQCSINCNETRKSEIYKKEIGEDFFKSWATKFVKK